jgi:hypothetical protein
MLIEHGRRQADNPYTTAMKVVFSHSVISLASGLNLIDALRSV